MKGRNSLFNSVAYSMPEEGTLFYSKVKPLSKPKAKKEISDAGKDLLSQAKEDVTKNIIKELYRPGAKIGDGGTADALKREKQTGKKVGDRSHEQKAKERASQIRKILSKNPNHPDKTILNKLLNDLENALKGDD